ncbi:MAG: hypothetical protein WD426_00020 [Anditalea sp.]
MMTKKIPIQRTILKLVKWVPLFSLMLLFFSTHSYTQEGQKGKPEVMVQPGEGASAELLEEYDKTIEGMKTIKTLSNGKKILFNDLGKVNRKRMAEIYSIMSEDQRMVGERKSTGKMFLSMTTLPKRNPPTSEFFKELVDANKFGVWIDGKRVQNKALAKYSSSDFDLFYKSRLMKNAKNYGKHKYQVNLYTSAYYEEMVKNYVADQ